MAVQYGRDADQVDLMAVGNDTFTERPLGARPFSFHRNNRSNRQAVGVVATCADMADRVGMIRSACWSEPGSYGLHRCGGAPGEQSGDGGEEGGEQRGGVEGGEDRGDAADEGAHGVAGVAPEAVDAERRGASVGCAASLTSSNCVLAPDAVRLFNAAVALPSGCPTACSSGAWPPSPSRSTPRDPPPARRSSDHDVALLSVFADLTLRTVSR